ncbi:MAG: molybdopterin-dependent oxidoreductase, partial [Anaerolineae bacterium]|nr:molybdopterin-dependent oxidoreductase [Anaerolineae bacterium]
LWWLRVKQAAERGAQVIVANPRRTKLERSAAHTLRYDYGQAPALVTALLSSISPKTPNLPDAAKHLTKDKAIKAAAESFAAAENAVVLYGSEGTDAAISAALAQACANLLVATGHIGRPNNGLIAVWDQANAQGAWDIGLRPSPALLADLKAAKAVYITAADPAGDLPDFAAALDAAEFVVVQELHLTATAELADVVLPAQAFTEREGTYTSGERRVQRFYPAVPAAPELLADFAITAQIAAHLGLDLEKSIPARVMARIAENVADYAGIDYQELAQVTEQWPQIGRQDVYYGGTTYDNSQGLGVQLAPAAQRGESISLTFNQLPEPAMPKKGMWAVPVTLLYDQGSMLAASEVLQPRLAKPHVVLNPQDAAKLGVEWGAQVKVKLNGVTVTAAAEFDNSLPSRVVLVPRSLGMPLLGPAPVEIKVK